MGYRLSVDRPVGADVRRIAQEQLARAERELSASVRRFSGDRVHRARKRLKKVRVRLRLVRPVMGQTYRRENRPLANREAVTHDIAGHSRALSAPVGRLHTEHTRAAQWTLRATVRPTARRLHTWRRRVKDHWLQLRLIEGLCAHGLGADRRAQTLASRVYRDKPRAFVRRVERLWNRR